MPNIHNTYSLKNRYLDINQDCSDADARYWRNRYDEEYAKLKTELALAKHDTKALTVTAGRANDLILGGLGVAKLIYFLFM